MKYPWANVFLLVLCALEGLSGLSALLWGAPDKAIALQVHRVGGFAIVALLIWKSQNVVAPLLRRNTVRRHPVAYGAFLFFLGPLFLILGLGLAWSHYGPFHIWTWSGVSWHISLSVLIIPFILWHTLFHRWSLRTRFWAERRSFLRLSGLFIAGFLLWRVGELANHLFGLSGAGRRFTGSYEAASFSGNAFPQTSWLNDDPSPVDVTHWRLQIHGVVDRPLKLTYEEVNRYSSRLMETIDCTGGWFSTQQWEGLPLGEVLAQAGVNPAAASVTVHSVTGYYRRFSLAEAERYLLATRVEGQSISHGHGFPMRLVAPGKRGYDWVKWVVAIEVNDTSKWLQPPLPLQ